MLRKHKKSGQSVVEYALMLPIFLFLFMGIVDFGITMHCWSTLNLQCVDAARAGAKRTSQLIARNFFTANTHAGIAAVRSAFWVRRSPLMATASYQFSDANIVGVGVSTNTVTVSASYNVKMWTPLLNGLLGGVTGNPGMTLSGSASERKE